VLLALQSILPIVLQIGKDMKEQEKKKRKCGEKDKTHYYGGKDC
jgi:hypothetical protein